MDICKNNVKYKKISQMDSIHTWSKVLKGPRRIFEGSMTDGGKFVNFFPLRCKKMNSSGLTVPKTYRYLQFSWDSLQIRSRPEMNQSLMKVTTRGRCGWTKTRTIRTLNRGRVGWRQSNIDIFPRRNNRSKQYFNNDYIDITELRPGHKNSCKAWLT